MIVKILIDFAIQIVSTVGVIVLFGMLIALCNKLFYGNFGTRGRAVCYITGFLGTPIHELSHALFCLIFGHKITEIKLFQVNSDDGTLGYVSHSYRKRNVYHRIGNFFIGIAPIVVITAILYLIAYLLLPQMTAEMFSYMGGDGSGNVSEYLMALLSVKVFFTYIGNYRWWIFLIIGMFLALHMNLSTADIKGSADGLIFLVAALLIADTILAVIHVNLLGAFTRIVVAIGGFLIAFLSLSLVISVFAVAVSFLFRAVLKK